MAYARSRCWHSSAPKPTVQRQDTVRHRHLLPVARARPRRGAGLPVTGFTVTCPTLFSLDVITAAQEHGTAIRLERCGSGRGGQWRASGDRPGAWSGRAGVRSHWIEAPRSPGAVRDGSPVLADPAPGAG